MFLQLFLLLLLLMVLSLEDFGFSPPQAVMAGIGPGPKAGSQRGKAKSVIVYFAYSHRNVSKVAYLLILS